MAVQEKKVAAEGKTKIIWELSDDQTAVRIENKKDITAFDNPEFTKQLPTKPVYATTTTCRVFELLQSAGIPVAYREQLTPTEFLADKCTMIALEVVARRYALGSFLKRHPEMEEDPPLRFSNLVTEFFLKTTNGGCVDRWGQRKELGLKAEKGEEDPLILDPHAEVWHLVHPKKPSWEDGVELGTIEARSIVDNERTNANRIVLVGEMEFITKQVFLVLEKAWAMMNCRFIDLKIEFGINTEGVLVVSDVVDNDSWRLRDRDWQELSKQAFRDGEALDKVEKKYGTVAAMLEQFSLPEQALVLWRGSEKDTFPVADPVGGIATECVTLSGHKATRACLRKLVELERTYPSGVILVKVGMSNGLGPILAAHTSWPVIAIPANLQDFPVDIWSSLRTPSGTPLLVCPENNAVRAALNILAQHNPTLYMQQQLAVENLDF